MESVPLVRFLAVPFHRSHAGVLVPFELELDAQLFDHPSILAARLSLRKSGEKARSSSRIHRPL
jgi:hypothetical protein